MSSLPPFPAIMGSLQPSEGKQDFMQQCQKTITTVTIQVHITPSLTYLTYSYPQLSPKTLADRCFLYRIVWKTLEMCLYLECCCKHSWALLLQRALVAQNSDVISFGLP